MMYASSKNISPFNTRVFAWVLVFALTAFSTPRAWSAYGWKAKDATVGAMAYNDSVLAIGMSSGGVRLMNEAGTHIDSLLLPEFGARQRIYDLAWWKNWLLIASEGGLTVWDVRRHQTVVHLSGAKLGFSQAGAFSLALRGSDLWIGGNGALAKVNLEQKRMQASWVIPGNPGRVQSVLILGGFAYVGTESAGVRVLDMARVSWKGFDRFDGLPDNQVTGLALVGPQIYVGTLQGLGRIDLALDAASTINTSWNITYMTEQNGTLMMNTLDGLCSFNGTTQKGTLLELQDKLQTVGRVIVWNGIIITGSDGKGLVRIPYAQNILNSGKLEMLPQGFSFAVDPALFDSSMSIAVRLWYPERASVNVGMDAMPGTSPEERLVKLPDDAVGYFVVELGLFKGKVLLERRSISAYRDRTPPNLELEGVPPFVRDSVLQLRGRVVGKSLTSLEIQPGAIRIPIGEQGNFESSIPLKLGANALEIVVKNQAGSEVRYPVQTIYDGEAPRVTWSQSDTVTESTIHWELPFYEPNLKSVQISPEGMAVATPSDSLLLLNFHNLKAGSNAFELRMEDEAGNVLQKSFSLVMLDDRARIVQTMEKQAKVAQAPVVITRVDTVKIERCSNPSQSTVVVTPAQSQAQPSIHVIRYHLQRGETLRIVAEKFYGDREMFAVIAAYNYITDSEDMHHLPVGKALLIPIWENFQHGPWNVKQGLKNYEKAVGK